MSGKKSKKNLKFASIAWALALMLLAVVILINVAASFFDIRIDMTPNKVYTMSDTSKDYLNSIDKDVELYFLYDLETMKVAEDASDVSELISFMEAYGSFDRIDLIDIDPEKNPDVVKELNPDNDMSLKEGDIVVKCGDVIKKVAGSEMYVYEYSDTPDANGNYLAESKTFMGENLITGAIKSVVDGYTPAVYFTKGHGENSLSDDYKQFYKRLRSLNYDPKELDLKKETAVPEDAAIIIVPGPQQDITADEKQKLEDYMDGGGNLSLLMSPLDNGTDFDNIVSIMHEYGIGMDYTKAYETDTSRHLSNDKYFITADLVRVNTTGESTGSGYDMNDPAGSTSSGESSKLDDLTSAIISGTQNLTSFIPPSRTFFQYSADNASNLKICPLLMTSDTAKVEACGGTRSKESAKEINNINSNSELWLSAYSVDTARNDSKLVVMPNAEFITDECQKEGYTIPSLFLYLSTVSWMSDTNIDMGIPTKVQTLDYMVLATKNDTNIVIGIIAAAPILVAAAGVIIWLRRRHS